MSILAIVSNQREQSNIQEFERYKRYCDNVCEKPFEQKTLSKYVDQLNSGDLVICDCCGEVFHYEHSFTARYDYDKTVCPDCHEDGN